MRIVHYNVYNKITGKHVRTFTRSFEAANYVASMADAENYVVCTKWLSI